MAIELMTSTRTSGKKNRTSEIAEVASKIKPVSELDPYAKMVVYGRNKVGKTRFVCSSDLPTLLVDCNERGFASVRKRPNVQVYELMRWEDVDPLYWYLRSADNPFKGGVLAIDTITMLATIGMKWVLKDDSERDFGRDPLTPDKRSWGKLGEALKDVIIRFRNLPMHVIFTAQEKVTSTEDDDGGTVQEVHPEISPSPRSTLLGAVGIIGRIYTREVESAEGKKTMERRMLLGAHPKYVSGNRYEELKNVERNPNLGDFLKRIEGELNA